MRGLILGNNRPITTRIILYYFDAYKDSEGQVLSTLRRLTPLCFLEGL